MNPEDVRRLIRMVLHLMPSKFYSLAVENLLFGTAAHESGGFKYIWQINGPALSMFQIEPATLDDLCVNYLAFRPELSSLLDSFRPPVLSRGQALVSCPAYAIVAARLIYRRHPEPIPRADDLAGMAALYKKRWNTRAGAATEQDFIDACEKYST